MSQGETNGPFLMFTTLPVRAAATRRSVCRQRKAGIWRMSRLSAASTAWAGSWMSDTTGTFSSSRSRARMRSPFSGPGPRKEDSEVRLALSNEALNT